MNKKIVAISILSLVILLGCGKKQDTSTPAPQTGTGKMEIPLDENMPGCGVSLTRNLYVVFDGSGSMDERYNGKTKLDGAKEAIRTFMKKVPDDMNLGLYVFDHKGQGEVVALGPGNHQRFLAAVEGVRAGGGTPLAKGMRYGTDKLVEQYKRQLGYGEYRLVVVTDGQADEIPEAATYAAKYGIPIYAIGLMVGENHPLRRHATYYIAADNFDQLAKALEETLAELPSFDSIEFPEDEKK